MGGLDLGTTCCPTRTPPPPGSPSARRCTASCSTPAPASPPAGQVGLRAATENAWLATRPVATGALIPGADGGKLVLLAPDPAPAPRRGGPGGAGEPRPHAVGGVGPVRRHRGGRSAPVAARPRTSSPSSSAFCSRPRASTSAAAGSTCGAAPTHTRFLAVSHAAATRSADPERARIDPRTQPGGPQMTPITPAGSRVRGAALRQARLARVRMIRRRVVAGAWRCSSPPGC